jgi:sulfatase maturation enzyme AslB (radical SAM superfamily)
MCYHKTMTRPKGEMPFELFKKCADQIAAVSPDTQIWFSFHGEPLLVPDLLLRMFRYAASIGLRSLNLNTNGMLLGSNLVDPLFDSGVTLIVFGIDGLSVQCYEKIRIGGNHKSVYANVERCLEKRHATLSGPDIMVQFIEMNENAHELEAFKSYWLNRGAIVKVRRKLSWGDTHDTSVSVSTDQRIPCPWAINLMHLTWDGKVPRCPGDIDGQEGVGSAWDDSLEVLWQRLGVYRKNQLTKCFDQLPRLCGSCKDWMVGAAEKIRPSWGPFNNSAEPGDPSSF